VASQVETEVAAIADLYGRKNVTGKWHEGKTFSLGYEARGNRHLSGSNLIASKQPITQDFKSELVSGRSGQSEISSQDASKEVVRYQHTGDFFFSLLRQYLGGVIVDRGYAQAVSDFAAAIEEGSLDPEVQSTWKPYSSAVWNAFSSAARSGKLYNPRFHYYSRYFSGYSRSF